MNVLGGIDKCFAILFASGRVTNAGVVLQQFAHCRQSTFLNTSSCRLETKLSIFLFLGIDERNALFSLRSSLAFAFQSATIFFKLFI